MIHRKHLDNFEQILNKNCTGFPAMSSLPNPVLSFIITVFSFMSKLFTSVTSDLGFKIAVLLFVIHFVTVKAAFVRRVCIHGSLNTVLS